MESTRVTLDPAPIRLRDPSDYRPELTDIGKDKAQFRIFKVNQCMCVPERIDTCNRKKM